jgi:hypothetical protein
VRKSRDDLLLSLFALGLAISSTFGHCLRGNEIDMTPVPIVDHESPVPVFVDIPWILVAVGVDQVAEQDLVDEGERAGAGGTREV